MKKLAQHQLESLSGGVQALPIEIPIPQPGDPICGALGVLSMIPVGSAGLTISKEYCEQLWLR